MNFSLAASPTFTKLQKFSKRCQAHPHKSTTKKYTKQLQNQTYRMNSILLKNKINHFWEWFVKHEKQFREISDPVATRELLDNQVLQFGAFSWEIGKGQEKPHTFTISPNGDAKMLSRSEAIIGEAPELAHWTFFPAKPAQDWNFIFEMFDSFMLQQTIDAAEWEFIFRITHDRKLNVLIYTENIDFLDEDDKLNAAEFVLNQIIGEMDKIYYINSISFIEDLDENQEQDLKALTELKFEFEKLLDELL